MKNMLETITGLLNLLQQGRYVKQAAYAIAQEEGIEKDSDAYQHIENSLRDVVMNVEETQKLFLKYVD